MARPLLLFPLRMQPSFRSRRGFTLIELMIVVAIVGILAVIAVVGYRRLILQSKMTEATGVVSAIRVAQEDYKVERGVYADIGKDPCPGTGLATPLIKTQWLPGCVGGGAQGNWTRLPVHVDGPTQFGYVTFTSPSAPGDTMNGGFTAFVTITAIDTLKPWYIVQARADLDGNGAPYTQVEATSHSNQIFTANDGN